MITIKLTHQDVRPEVDQSLIGTPFAEWPADQLYEAARGRWGFADKVEKERYALVHSGNVVLAVIEIDGWDQDDPEGKGKRRFHGRPVGKDHPVAKRFLDQAPPIGGKAQIGFAYFHADSLAGQYTPCACGCGDEARKTWLPGHDHKAIHERIRERFDGDVLEFVNWFDRQFPAA